MKKLLALAIVGIAVKYFLDSEKGTQAKSQLKDWLQDAQDAFGDTIKGAKGTARQVASDLQ
jgi:hypothetical protein